jgi:hypothetical protein
VALTRLILGIALCVGLALGGMAVARAVWPPSGDPGGRIMRTLTPLVREVPGYERGPVPWVSAVPWPGPARWAVRWEPKQDSCDGMSGTWGWDPVVVQVEFQWSGSARALRVRLNRQLVPKGLEPRFGGEPSWVDAGDMTWMGPYGGNASVAVVLQSPTEGTGNPVFDHQWQADIEARAIGRMVGPC